jgi:hypothetical protein
MASAPGHSAAIGWRDSNSAPPPQVLPARSRIAAVTCDSSQPVVTAGARWAPLAAGRVCTQRVPPAPIPSGRGRLWRSGPPRPGTGSAGRAPRGRCGYSRCLMHSL